MNHLFDNNRILFFSIALCIGTGVALIVFTAKPAQENRYDKIKKIVLEHVLKDGKGEPIISKDSVQQYLLFETDDYRISYQKAYDLFLISINGSPFNDARAKAEQQFLALLKGEREAACSFHVEITTPSFANPELSGHQFPLSFCEP